MPTFSQCRNWGMLTYEKPATLAKALLRLLNRKTFERLAKEKRLRFVVFS